MNKRIIPCLDIKGGRVVKGTRFLDLRDLLDPQEAAVNYASQSADELVFYDITASTEKRGFDAELFSKVASSVTLPLTVGGAIASLEDIERALTLGAAKVSINTGAINDPSFIAQAAKRFGSEKIMLAIDARLVDGGYCIFRGGGSINTGIDAVDWVKKGEVDGAGETVINSIDADGVKGGYDLPMLEAILAAVNIPIIASGGAGKKEDFLKLFTELPDISAALAASVFHYNEVKIDELRSFLAANGIQVS
ncbi:MAG: imidazole glycerol phosphate synthase cyclase subunit [Oscillospiraceae bacterium]|nr:imidazole glycerol phosphate synthase cyclase subunit [Oscillospiraceae bacterium]